MDAAAFEQVYGAFQDFHAYFAPPFGRRETRDHSRNYLQALLVQSQERRNAENLSETVPASARLTGVCMGFSRRGMAGDLQVGLGFRPGFGQRPYPAPEPAPVQQSPQPGDAVTDYADGPSRLLPAAAVSGRERPGRRSRAAGGHPPVIGVFHPGPIGQGQQRRRRQHEPVPRNPRRISPPGLLPLPTQVLDRPEPQLGPEAERVPTHPNFVRRKAGQDATAFCGGSAEGGPAPGPRGVRTGNEGARPQPPTALGSHPGLILVASSAFIPSCFSQPS